MNWMMRRGLLLLALLYWQRLKDASEHCRAGLSTTAQLFLCEQKIRMFFFHLLYMIFWLTLLSPWLFSLLHQNPSATGFYSAFWWSNCYPIKSPHFGLWCYLGATLLPIYKQPLVTWHKPSMQGIHQHFLCWCKLSSLILLGYWYVCFG